MEHYNYVEAIAVGFPGVQCHAFGDPFDYNNLVWSAGAPLPSKEALDAWIQANPRHTSRRITVLAFRNRFSIVEKVAIDLASIDDPTAPTERRQMSAMLRVMGADSAAATAIELDRADTIQGVRMLEQFGIIGQGRANQILNNPIQAHEIPLAR